LLFGSKDEDLFKCELHAVMIIIVE